MSSKYFALLKSKNINIEEAIKEDKIKEHARYLIDLLDSGSEFLQINTIENLSLFTDHDFVKKALIEKYRRTDSMKIKTLIKSVYDGTIEAPFLNAIIEDMKYWDKVTEG